MQSSVLNCKIIQCLGNGKAFSAYSGSSSLKFKYDVQSAAAVLAQTSLPGSSKVAKSAVCFLSILQGITPEVPIAMVFVSFTNHVAKSNNIAFLIHK